MNFDFNLILSALNEFVNSRAFIPFVLVCFSIAGYFVVHWIESKGVEL